MPFPWPHMTTAGAVTVPAARQLHLQVTWSVPHSSSAWIWELWHPHFLPEFFYPWAPTPGFRPSSSFQHHPFRAGDPPRSPFRGAVVGGLWQRLQASSQPGPRGRELFTGSQMLEMKRTCKNTSHSSIPPCNVGSFPRAYGLLPSDLKGSIITNKYVLSAPCMLCLVPITRGGDRGTLCDKFTSRMHCLSTPRYLSHHLNTDICHSQENHPRT